MSSRGFVGCLLGVATGIMWAFSSPISRYLSSQPIPMITFNVARLLMTTLIIGLWFVVKDRGGLKVPWSTLGILALLAPLVGLGLYYGFAMSVVYVPVAIGLVIHYTFPLCVTLLVWVLYGERPLVADWVSAGLILIGVFVSGLTPEWRLDASLQWLGVWWGLFAVAGMVAQTLVSRKVTKEGRIKPLTLLFYTHLMGSFWVAFYASLTDATGLGLLTAFDWALVGVQALFSSALAYGCYALAMNYIRASTASMMCSIEIVGAVGISWLWLGERPTLPHIMGCLFVCAAIILVGAAQILREGRHGRLKEGERDDGTDQRLEPTA